MPKVVERVLDTCPNCSVCFSWEGSKRRWCWWCEGKPSIFVDRGNPNIILDPSAVKVRPARKGLVVQTESAHVHETKSSHAKNPVQRHRPARR